MFCSLILGFDTKGLLICPNTFFSRQVLGIRPAVTDLVFMITIPMMPCKTSCSRTAVGGHGKAICSLGPGKRYNYRWIYEREEKEKEMKGKGRTTRKKSEGYIKKCFK